MDGDVLIGLPSFLISFSQRCRQRRDDDDGPAGVQAVGPAGPGGRVLGARLPPAQAQVGQCLPVSRVRCEPNQRRQREFFVMGCSK